MLKLTKTEKKKLIELLYIITHHPEEYKRALEEIEKEKKDAKILASNNRNN